jgi:hypothetical protein
MNSPTELLAFELRPEMELKIAGQTYILLTAVNGKQSGQVKMTARLSENPTSETVSIAMPLQARVTVIAKQYQF